MCDALILVDFVGQLKFECRQQYIDSQTLAHTPAARERRGNERWYLLSGNMTQNQLVC